MAYTPTYTERRNCAKLGAIPKSLATYENHTPDGQPRRNEHKSLKSSYSQYVKKTDDCPCNRTKNHENSSLDTITKVDAILDTIEKSLDYGLVMTPEFQSQIDCIWKNFETITEPKRNISPAKKPPMKFTKSTCPLCETQDSLQLNHLSITKDHCGHTIIETLSGNVKQDDHTSPQSTSCTEEWPETIETEKIVLDECGNLMQSTKTIRKTSGPKCFNKSEESDADRDCTECQEIDDCSVCCSTSSTDSDCHCVTNKTIYDYGSGAVTPRPKQIAKRVPPSVNVTERKCKLSVSQKEDCQNLIDDMLCTIKSRKEILALFRQYKKKTTKKSDVNIKTH